MGMINDGNTIQEANIFPCNRVQFEGYYRAWETLKDGTRITMVTFANDAVKKEGERVSGFHDTQEKAWNVFCAALKVYLSDKPGVILWRMRPEAVLNKTIENPDWIQNPNDKSISWVLPNPEIEWYVICRLAVTEDLRFTYSKMIRAIDIK